MTVTYSPRLGLEQFSTGSDPHPGRVKSNERVALLEALVAIAQQGPTNSRPSAGKGRGFYWDTTVERLFYDNGTAWKEVTTNGGGGPGSAVTVGGAAVEGSSARSARADHTHNLPLATAAVDGAMSKADKAKLDSASAAATANTLVMLDANGRTQVAAPAAAGDTANKSYVDGLVNGKANTTHVHAAADITSGVFAAARLPAATSAAAGSMSAADKAKLDAASPGPTASTLVMLDANGRAQVAAPSLAGEIANKSYVDTQDATKANVAHSHAWADITSGVPTSFTPSAHVHAAGDVTSGVFAAARLPAATGAAAGSMSAGDKTKLDAASAAATPSTIVMLDAAGRAAVAAPSAAGDIANKSYVDTQIATRAASTHTHTWAQITGAPATYAPSAHTHDWTELTGVPTASRTGSGIMSQSAYTLLYDATTAYATNNIVMRDGFGNIQINRPTADIHGANKLYVDDQMNAAKAGKLDVSVFTAAISTTATARAIRSPNLGSFMTFYDNGVIEAPAIFNTNAASGSNFRAVWVNSTGGLGYNLSSEKYKTNIQSYEVPLSVLEQIEPKRFQYKENVAEMGDAAPLRVNFLAEDLYDAGLTEYISFDGEGTARENCETINEQLMVNALWSFARQQQREIAELKELVGK